MIGDHNQYGERYGTQVMDAQLGGGGASAVGDGIDQSGGFVTPRPAIPNVETSEMHGPMLYLYRSFLRDSGGDGAWRGGRAAGLAFTPHGIERLRCTLTTQGVEVPVSPGLFGGWPGQCNEHVVIRGTRLPEMMARGELLLELSPASGALELAPLGGRAEQLPAKAEFELRPGDVLKYSWSGGGGFGDPLERPLELVAADLEAGIVSAGRAARAYGLISGPARVERAAGELRGDEPRRARRQRVPADGPSSAEPAEQILPFGPLMRVARTAVEAHVECRCGWLLGSAAGNWKLGAARAVLSPAELPDGIRLHRDLDLVKLSCPGCGALLSVEICESGADPMADLRI